VVTVPASVGDEVAAAAFELGSCGVQTQEAGELARLVVYFADDYDAAAVRCQLQERLPQAGHRATTSIEVQSEPEADWMATWRRHYRPEWATDRIVVHPPWIPVTTAPGQIAIAIDPAMAFGTGGHESTQLALQALQESGCTDRTCLDVGTGSGVLAIAAIHLGARQLTGLDIDPIAVDNARHNLDANLDDEARRVRVLAGSLDTVEGERFDVIVANLESHLVRPLLGSIARALAPAGIGLFSGLVTHEQQRFTSWLEASGFAVEQSWTKGSWFSVRARRRD
jgi:ribosomal protein L11 methyltransferase